MTQRFITCIALVIALTMLGGCGGKKSKKKAKGPDPAPAVVPEAVDPNDDNPNVPEEPQGPGDTNPDGGDGTPDGGDGEPSGGDGTPGGGGEDPFELPTGVVNPTDPIFPGDPQDPIDANEGGEVLNPSADEVATPEPATLLTAAMGATLLGMRRKRSLK